MRVSHIGQLSPAANKLFFGLQNQGPLGSFVQAFLVKETRVHRKPAYMQINNTPSREHRCLLAAGPAAVESDPASPSPCQGKHLPDTDLFKESGNLQEPLVCVLVRACACMCMHACTMALLRENKDSATIP